jgi:hypothetical protein
MPTRTVWLAVLLASSCGKVESDAPDAQQQIDAAETIDASEIADADPSIDAGTPPAAPTGVTACRLNARNRIFWPPVADATSYNVYFATSAGVTKASTRIAFQVTGNSFVHDSLVNDTSYFYRVTANTGNAESDALSNEVTATPRSYNAPSNVLYAANNTLQMNTGAIYAWDAWSTSTTTTPDRTLSEAPANASTLLLQPRTGSVFVDPEAGLVYVSNAGPVGTPARRVTVYEGAASFTGTVLPARVLQNGDLQNVRGIVVDRTRNLMYVANRSPGEIVVYADACNAAGAPPVSRAKLSGATTTLNASTGIHLDAARDELYVANGTSVLVFAGMSTLTGTQNIAPSRVITLRDAALNTITMDSYGLTLDEGRDMLYITHRGTTVNPPAQPDATVFVVHGAHLANGLTTVSRTITLPAASVPMGAHVVDDRLFVNTDANGPFTIYSWTSASTRNGTVAPTLTPSSVYSANFTTVFYVP